MTKDKKSADNDKKTADDEKKPFVIVGNDDKKAAEDLKKMSYDGRDPNISWSKQNIKTAFSPEEKKKGDKILNEI